MTQEAPTPGTATEDPNAGASPPATPFGMRGVGKHALIYGFGVLLTKAASFLMLPVYTRYLTPADYGVMALIEMALDLISIVAGAQLVLGVFRFYHKADTEAERSAVVSTSLLALAASYGFVGVVTFLLADPLSVLVFRSDVHGGLVRIASGSLAFQSLIIVPLAYARVRDLSVLYVAASAARLVLSLGLAVLFLVGLGWGVRGVFMASLITNIVVGTGLAIWVLRAVGTSFSRAVTRDLLRYGIPLVVTQLAAFTLTFADRFFLQAAADEAVVGLYNLAYQFGFLLAVIGFTPFEQVWSPKRFEIVKRHDRDAILSQGFRYLNLVLLPVGVGIALFTEDVLRLVATPPFFSAADVVPIILIAYVLQSWTMVQDIGILVKERTGYVTVATWTAAGVALIAYWVLIPRYLAWGAAYATVLAFAVRYGLTYLFSQRLFPVRYEWGSVLRIAAFSIVTAVVSIALPPLPLAVAVPARLALFVVYCLAVWRFAGLSAAERTAIRNLLRTLTASVRTRLAVSARGS